MTDKLASFVAQRGARGVLVFDGSGEDLSYGPLEVRFAEHADTLLERLAAEHRDRERVCLVSSDSAVRGTSGQEVMKFSSATFTRTSRSSHTRANLRCAWRTSSTRKRGSGWNGFAAGNP